MHIDSRLFLFSGCFCGALTAYYAIFPDGTWLMGDTYVVNGAVKYGTMTADEVVAMNEMVQLFYQANEAVLQSDYYATGD